MNIHGYKNVTLYISEYLCTLVSVTYKKQHNRLLNSNLIIYQKQIH